MTLQDIKLVIWDLDETFWRGTISEGEIQPIEENIRFIRNTTDMGIVHSICSKNDFSVAKDRLGKIKLWEYFVFPSVDWTPKGSRIKNIIDTMKLRAVNVLFIDDNVQNLAEAKHFCPGIMTALPHEITPLYIEAENAEHKDTAHKRLKQYKVLEEKEASRSEFESNDDFLFSCNIRVTINNDCEKLLDRLHELIMRSNQLNYTKFRQPKEDLEHLIKNKDVKSGYVSVKDKFGDYGIVGFFAIENGSAIHYVFSCRTLGMKVEQYVYKTLGCPRIDIVGDVVSELNCDFLPPWINQEIDDAQEEQKTVQTSKILLKGPCDMSQMHAFLNSCSNLTREFTYAGDSGMLVEGHNHTAQIITALFASAEEKNSIFDDTPFLDKKMLDISLCNEKYDVVVLSMLTDGNLGIYRHKKSGHCIALCEKYYDITDRKNAQSYINGSIFTSGIKLTEAALSDFCEKYEYVNNSDWSITIQNLEKIHKYIGKDTKLVLLLGSEQECPKANQKPSYASRHLEHSLLNNAVRKWASDKENVILLPYDKYLRNRSGFLDTINHFEKRVYFELANDLAEIFSKTAGINVTAKSKKNLYISIVMQKLRKIRAKLRSIL